MFSKLAALATLTLALSAAAAPTPAGEQNKCNTGRVTCCNSTHQSQSAEAMKLTALLGLAAQGANTYVGQTCSPMTGVGASSGGSCSQRPMCCEDNHYHGLVVVGCTPINVGF